MVCIGFSLTCMSLVVHGDNRLLDTRTPTSACLRVLLPWSIDSSIACSSSWSCAAPVNVPIVNKEIDSSGTYHGTNRFNNSSSTLNMTSLSSSMTDITTLVVFCVIVQLLHHSHCHDITISLDYHQDFFPNCEKPQHLVTKDTTNSME